LCHRDHQLYGSFQILRNAQRQEVHSDCTAMSDRSHNSHP